jgi:hypothetical protein
MNKIFCNNLFWTSRFSSIDPNSLVSFCHHLASVIVSRLPDKMCGQFCTLMPLPLSALVCRCILPPMFLFIVTETMLNDRQNHMNKIFCNNLFWTSRFSSIDPKSLVSFCHHLASVIVSRLPSHLKPLCQFQPKLIWIILIHLGY